MSFSEAPRSVELEGEQMLRVSTHGVASAADRGRLAPNEAAILEPR